MVIELQYLLILNLYLVELHNKDKQIAGFKEHLKLYHTKDVVNSWFSQLRAIFINCSSTNQKLFFHIWKKENSTHSYEIDFLVPDNTKLIPIEVKSSESRNHSSINAFYVKYSNRISRRILFSQDDIGHDKMLELKPIYLAPIILSNICK